MRELIRSLVKENANVHSMDCKALHQNVSHMVYWDKASRSIVCQLNNDPNFLFEIIDNGNGWYTFERVIQEDRPDPIFKVGDKAIYTIRTCSGREYNIPCTITGIIRKKDGSIKMYQTHTDDYHVTKKDVGKYPQSLR